MMKTTIKYPISAILACLALVGCQEVDAPANSKPSVETFSVTGLTGHEAYLSGSVSTNATCYFLLSSTINLTEPDTIPASQQTIYASDSVSSNQYYYAALYDGLKPGNDYYVALCASDGRSEVRGNVVSFSTPTYLTIENVYLSDIDGYSTASFQPTQPIGSFVLTSWEYTYGIWGSYQNLQTTYSNSKFTMADGDDISLSSDVRVYAYYPYTTEYSNYYIPIKANESLYGKTATYLYGNSNTVNSDDTEAYITMHYALAKISLTITNANDDGATLSQITLENIDGNYLASSGEMNVFSGDISDLQDYDAHTRTCHQTLTSTAYTEDFMLIPTSFDENQVVVKLVVDGEEEQLALPAVTWSKGHHYTYQLTVDKGALRLGGIRVEAWDAQNGGSIDIKQD